MQIASEVTPGLPHRARLALVCDSLEDNFQSALVDAGLAAARAYDLDLLVVPSGKLGDEAGKNFVFELVPKWADGAIVAAHTIGHTATDAAMRHVLGLLSEIPTVTLGEVPGARCCLSIDNERAVYDLTQHLVVQHRYRRFAYICGPTGNAEAEARERGFNLALHEAGLPLPMEWRVVGNFTAEGGLTAIRELLDQRSLDLRQIDALVCANDAMAIAACQELERREVYIPRDIAVVGFDDTELARHLPAPLTTVRQPLRALLFDAVRKLLDGFARGSAPRGAYRYGAETVQRRSCGCPRLPNLPQPSTPALAHAGRASLREMEPAIREDLDPDFVVALDDVRKGWLGDALDALSTQLEDQGAAFYDTVETLCFGLLRVGRTTSGWQQALLTMRRYVARSLSDPDRLRDLDRFIDGALRLTSELATSFMARRREELVEHLRILGDATARLLSAPDLGTISKVTRASFPKLGVARGMVCLFDKDLGPEAMLTPLSVFGLHPDVELTPVLAKKLLFRLPRGQSWVIEPLCAGPRPLGLAVLQCGLAHVSWYERLRDALTAAVNGAQLIEQVQRLVVTDPLTGLHNRRYLTERIRRELDAERGAHLPLSLLVLDLDGFKTLNDERGHDTGDQALIEAARSIERCLRETDTLARFGGDEFVAILPATTALQAQTVAERVIRALPLALYERVAASLTCSVGIATIEQLGMGDAELFQTADQALLAAKRGGKNRAVHARDL